MQFITTLHLATHSPKYGPRKDHNPVCYHHYYHSHHKGLCSTCSDSIPYTATLTTVPSQDCKLQPKHLYLTFMIQVHITCTIKESKLTNLWVTLICGPYLCMVMHGNLGLMRALPSKGELDHAWICTSVFRDIVLLPEDSPCWSTFMHPQDCFKTNWETIGCLHL